MGRRGARPTEYAVVPQVLRAMREGCIFQGHPMEQTEAATLMGVSRETWSAWETGRRGMASHRLLKWLHMCEPYRKWDLPKTGWGGPGQPLDRVIWHRVAEPQGPFEMDVAKPVSDTPAPAQAPRDLLVPDASELEAPFMEQLGDTTARNFAGAAADWVNAQGEGPRTDAPDSAPAQEGGSE